MNTLIQAFIFLLDTFAGIFLLLVILRFILQLTRADFYNPLSQAIVKITNPLLLPIRKIVPGFFKIDIACIILALCVQLFFAAIMISLFGMPATGLPLVFAWAVIGCVLYVLNIYFVCLIILVISSFIAPMSTHPILVLTRQLCQPLLNPIQRMIPPAGGLDFSVFFLGIGIYLANILLAGIAQAVYLNTAFILGSFFLIG